MKKPELNSESVKALLNLARHLATTGSNRPDVSQHRLQPSPWVERGQGFKIDLRASTGDLWGLVSQGKEPDGRPQARFLMVVHPDDLALMRAQGWDDQLILEALEQLANLTTKGVRAESPE